MKKAREIYAAHHSFDLEKRTFTFHLTDDREEAERLNPDYRLASADELDQWSTGSDQFQDHACILQDGKYLWVSGTWVDEDSDEIYYLELVKVA